MSDRYAYVGTYWCAHCGQVTNRALWERFGGACSDGCAAIGANDRNLEARLWLSEWQTTVRARADVEKLLELERRRDPSRRART